MMLEVKHISSGYGKRKVLFDISFEIMQGEIVLLIGSNGSGKSTLLKAIYGLLPPFSGTTGKIIFDNHDITHLNASVLIKKGLMYIPQKNFCFDSLTVKENLDVASLALEKNKKLERREIVLQTFALLQPLLKRKAIRLSAGERQILALAMASLHLPKMMILDEPLTGLSPQNCELVLKNLAFLNNENGVSLLIVEHKIEPFLSLATKMIGLKLGKIFNSYHIKQRDELKQLYNLFT